MPQAMRGTCSTTARKSARSEPTAPRAFRPAAWGSLGAPLVSGHHGTVAVRWSSLLGFLHHLSADGASDTALDADHLGDGGAFDYDGDLDVQPRRFADAFGPRARRRLPFENASRVRTVTFSGVAADAQVHPTEGYTGTDPSDDDHRYRALTAVDSVNKDVHVLRLVLDEDRDFIPNAHDDLPLISGQWEDSDSDGFGDGHGTFPDACPSITGSSTFGLLGCLDLDNDGWDETTDDCPNNRGPLV